MKKIIKQIHIPLFLFLFLNGFLAIINADQPVPPMQKVPSPEEIEKMQHGLENALSDLGELVESLPPEEQKEFEQIFEEELAKVNAMNEDELLHYIKENLGPILPEEAAPMPPQPKPTQPTPQPLVEKKEKKVEAPKKIIKPQKPTKNKEDALKLLNAIITHIENFLRKAQIIQKFPGKVEKWGEQGKIKMWKPSLKWNTLKTQIEQLNQKLHKIKDRDPKTKEYKYLEDFLRDEALYNNLAKLRTTLEKYEPKIKVASLQLSSESLSKISKDAVQTIIGDLIEAIEPNILGIPQALDKIIEKYEPKAAEIKKKEEETAKRALEESRRVGVPTPPRVGGVAADEGFYGMPPSPTPYYTPPYAPELGGYHMRRMPQPPAPAKKTAAPSKEEVRRNGKGRGYVPVQRDATLQQIPPLLDKFSKELAKAQDYIKNKNLQNIENHIKTREQEIDKDLAMRDLPEAIKRVKNAGEEAKNVNRNLSRLTNEEQRKKYKKELQERFAGYKDPFNKIADQINKIRDFENIMLGKKYAYLGGEQKEQATPELIEQIKHPSSLYDLQENIKQLINAVEEEVAKKDEGQLKTEGTALGTRQAS